MRNDFFKYLLIYGRKKSVESETLPMTFKAKRTENLKNYRIYGNTVNGESVGELVTDSQSVNYGKYKIPVTLTANTAETIDIYLDKPLKKVGDEAEYVDYATQKWHRVRKNLFDEKYTNIGNTSTLYYMPLYVGVGWFTLSTTLPQYNDNYTYTNIFLMAGQQTSGATNGSHGCWAGHNKTIRTDDGYVTLAYRNYAANSSYNGDPRNYNTMLNAGTTDLPYEPYIENTEVDVTLPEIAVTTGTNTLTVGTEVQPSKVYLQGHISRGDNNAE